MLSDIRRFAATAGRKGRAAAGGSVGLLGLALMWDSEWRWLLLPVAVLLALSAGFEAWREVDRRVDRAEGDRLAVLEARSHADMRVQTSRVITVIKERQALLLDLHGQIRTLNRRLGKTVRPDLQRWERTLASQLDAWADRTAELLAVDREWRDRFVTAWTKAREEEALEARAASMVRASSAWLRELGTAPV